MAAADGGSVCAGTHVSSFLASEICWDKCLSKISKDILCILLIITNFFGTENFQA